MQEIVGGSEHPEILFNLLVRQRNNLQYTDGFDGPFP